MGLTRARRLRWVNPRALSPAHRAPSRAMTRGPPKRRAGALLPSAVTDGSVTGLGLQLAEVAQPPLAPQVVRRVDDGLDPHRPAVFRELLHARVLEESADRDVGAAGDNLGLAGHVELDRAATATGAFPGEGQLHAVGAAQVEVDRPPAPRRTRGPGAGRRRPGCVIPRSGASTVPTSSRPGGRDRSAAAAARSSTGRRTPRWPRGRAGRRWPAARPGPGRRRTRWTAR